MDPLLGLLVLVEVVALIAFPIVLAYAAMKRMRGRRTRFDKYIEAMILARAAAIYPHSLRGDPTPQIIESAELSRASNAARDAPNATR